jgi:hypothetical protein
MRGTMLSVFVLSVLPVSTALPTSVSKWVVDGSEAASIDASEPEPSYASGDDVAAGDGDDSMASCVASCPKGNKVVTCPDGVCECYCDEKGNPVCKCG